MVKGNKKKFISTIFSVKNNEKQEIFPQKPLPVAPDNHPVLNKPAPER
jgi:hypothetical protein